MLSQTSTDLALAIKYANKLITDESNWIHPFKEKEILFTDTERKTFKIPSRSHKGPCKLYLSYGGIVKANADFFVSKRVEEPNEKKNDIKKLNARPSLILIPSG